VKLGALSPWFNINAPSILKINADSLIGLLLALRETGV
jgi:hypothetical protein